jgi:fatty-acyl-CoA synthase
MLIGNELRRLTERCPQREALVFEERRWTFSQLNADVNRLANALAALGIHAGDRIAISLSNRPELFAAYFAAQKLGAVAVLLNYSLTASELTYIASNCAPEIWFCDARTASAVETALTDVGSIRHCVHCGAGVRSPRAIHIDNLLSGALESEPPPAPIDATAPSLIMYTSGTTGRPKGVVLSHAAQWINTVLMVAELGFRPTDRALQIAPLFHVAAFHVVALPVLFVGGSNVMIEKYDAERAASWVDSHAVTTVLGAPTHFELWSGAGSLPPKVSRERLRHVIITGAPARLDTINWITERVSPMLWDVYGQTEACSLITIVPPDQTHRMSAVNCIGRPLIGMDVTLVPERSPLREGLQSARPSQGELIARGPKLMNGYYRLPEKTQQTIEEGWLRTGDLVKVDGDGYYYYLGRVDDMIITGGENVYPAEIEEFLLTCPGVADCVVVGVPDPVWGQLIAAYVVSDGRFERDKVEETTRRALAPHKRPRRWFEIAEIPRNPSGKVLVRKLRELSPQPGAGDGRA